MEINFQKSFSVISSIGVFFTPNALNAATSFTHESGDNALGGSVTTSNYSQDIAGRAPTINAAYAGAFAADRTATTQARRSFQNLAIGGLPDSTLFRLGVTSNAGDVTVSAPFSRPENFESSAYNIVVGSAVSQVTITFTYLGQIDDGITYNNGFTGRFSGLGGNPQTNVRGIAVRNSSTNAEVLNISTTAQEFGGAADALPATDFYDGVFGGENYGTIAATVTGFGTGTVNGDFENGEGLNFNNGSDLGDMLISQEFVITAAGGGLIESGSSLIFTFDVMTHVPIPVPEPTTSILSIMSLVGFLGLRRRSNK